MHFAFHLLLILLLLEACASKSEKDAISEISTGIQVFEPGLISDGYDNRDMTISPTGDELFYTIQYENRVSVIMQVKKENDKWNEPAVAWFSGKYKDLEAAFSPDGNQLYFASNRPVSDSTTEPGDFNIWYLEKTNGQWSAPVFAGGNINTEKDEYYPSISKNKSLYFTRDNGESLEDIFVSHFDSGRFQMPIVLPEEVNSKGYDFNAFIDPDEEYILFTSYKRADDLGGGDLYMSKKVDGNWLPATHLGPEINSSAIDYCPFVSFDGQYFYFTSSRVVKSNSVDSAKSKSGLMLELNYPGRGSDDIYRIPFSELKKISNQQR